MGGGGSQQRPRKYLEYPSRPPNNEEGGKGVALTLPAFLERACTAAEPSQDTLDWSTRLMFPPPPFHRWFSSAQTAHTLRMLVELMTALCIVVLP